MVDDQTVITHDEAWLMCLLLIESGIPLSRNQAVVFHVGSKVFDEHNHVEITLNSFIQWATDKAHVDDQIIVEVLEEIGVF
jgi:hypothetical protein